MVAVAVVAVAVAVVAVVALVAAAASSPIDLLCVAGPGLQSVAPRSLKFFHGADVPKHDVYERKDGWADWKPFVWPGHRVSAAGLLATVGPSISEASTECLVITCSYKSCTGFSDPFLHCLIHMQTSRNVPKHAHSERQ